MSEGDYSARNALANWPAVPKRKRIVGRFVYLRGHLDWPEHYAHAHAHPENLDLSPTWLRYRVDGFSLTHLNPCTIATKESSIDWDYSDVRLFPDPASAKTFGNGLKAASMRPPQMKLQFQSKGLTFTLDAMPNNYLLGQKLSRSESGQALIGMNLRIENPDGTSEFVAKPFARFFVTGSLQ